MIEAQPSAESGEIPQAFPKKRSTPILQLVDLVPIPLCLPPKRRVHPPNLTGANPPAVQRLKQKRAIHISLVCPPASPAVFCGKLLAQEKVPENLAHQSQVAQRLCCPLAQAELTRLRLSLPKSAGAHQPCAVRLRSDFLRSNRSYSPQPVCDPRPQQGLHRAVHKLVGKVLYLQHVYAA
jgi:hypothetical protein